MCGDSSVRKFHRRWGRCFGAVVLFLANNAGAVELPIFDAHIHYSHDAWDLVSPQQAVSTLRRAGVVRALVSSSGDDGTQKLHREAPDLILPSLRPYRARGELYSWMRDPRVIPYLQERLKTYRYVAIGEYHIYGEEADLPVVRQVIQLARSHGLFMHIHSDADAVDRVFGQDPDARVLWAHAGFEPPSRVRAMMQRYPRLWADLSMRSDIAFAGRVEPEWRAMFLDFPDRFMIGTDTYEPELWDAIGSHMQWVRAWLRDLPGHVAEQIAFRNAEQVLTAAYRLRK